MLHAVNLKKYNSAPPHEIVISKLPINHNCRTCSISTYRYWYILQQHLVLEVLVKSEIGAALKELHNQAWKGKDPSTESMTMLTSNTCAWET